MKASFVRTARHAAVAVLMLGTAIVIPARHAGAASAGQTVRVEITKFAFAPKEITVAPGTHVIWTNRDETPHTVASSDKSFASKGLDTDDTFEQVFATEGDFAYICTVHPFMTGVVHVHKP